MPESAFERFEPGIPRRGGIALALPEPAAASRPNVIVFQNCYSTAVEKMLDPAFVPVDGTRNPRTDYREVALFLRMYHSGGHRSAEYTGIVSPKFNEKSRITGEDFLRFIARNPGFDTYFINPYPINAYFSLNVWEQGEIFHPGLMKLTQELFDAAGIQCNVFTMGRNSHDTLLYCNYWVGNERFWDRFMDMNMRVLQAAETLSPRMRERLFSREPLYPDPVPVLPFVFERLFSTLLLIDPSLEPCAYRHSRDYILSCRAGSEEEMLGVAFMDVIDEIDQRGEYNARDMAIFRAVQCMRRRLYWQKPRTVG